MNKLPNIFLEVDILGIGFGPSNIALAIALEEAGASLRTKFIEARPTASWQPGMMMAGSDVQHNALRDLVTPRNPRSHYTFPNYLKEMGRLFDYLNLGLAYPLRSEYAAYVEWVAAQFSNQVQYGTRALDLAPNPDGKSWRVETNAGVINAKAIIVATGRNANIPAIFRPWLGERIFHLNDYLPRIAALADKGALNKVVVLGASQSAVEINLDLLNRDDRLEVHSVHRSFSIRQKDTSPYSDHVYFPDFVDYFYSASEASRDRMKAELRGTNYSAADSDVIHALYVKTYEDRLCGRSRFHLHNNTAVEDVKVTDTGVELVLREHVTQQAERLQADAIVLATGFFDLTSQGNADGIPSVLSGIRPSLLNQNGRIYVNRDYRIDAPALPPIYLNGLCENTHGLGDAGSFSLVSLRANEILESVTHQLMPESNYV